MSPVYVDNRGSGEQEIAKLLKKKHLSVEIRHIDSGDYVFGEVAIERKTVNDLIASVTGGNRHLWEQIKVLKNTYKKPIVIIEGGVDWKDRLIAGIVSSILLGWGVPVIQTYNQEDTVDCISALFTKYGAGKSAGYPPVAVRKAVPIHIIKWSMLQCIAGVGPTSAKRLLEAFPDLFFAAYNAEYIKETLKQVKGVNKNAKERFYKVFTGVPM